MRKRRKAAAPDGTMADPITGRLICRDCWNRVHGTKKEPVCKARACQCGCKDGPKIQASERAAKGTALRERKRLELELLEADDNPLRAFNPDYREQDAD